MPNRIIKESICESESLSSCSLFANDLYKRLITYADDYGRFNADTQIMLARLYPREMDSVDQEDIVNALIELSGCGKIGFYTSQQRKHVYGCFPRWAEHQRVRDSKSKCPDPDDTTVNDWYLQRFIPTDLKTEIIERDGFKCQLCGKFITSDMNANRLVKHGSGMYHIDHIVPVVQGGRATLENLRLTCPKCNQKRKRRFSFKEILQFAESGGELPQAAADCCRNPIQSNPNPNTNPIQHAQARGVVADGFDLFWSAYPKKVGKDAARKAWPKTKGVSIDTILAAVENQKKSAQWQKDNGQYIPNPATWINQGRWQDEVTTAAGYVDGRTRNLDSDEAAAIRRMMAEPELPYNFGEEDDL